MSLIKLVNVKKNYLDKSFDLEIFTNDKIIVVGKNGSGKTTLIKLLSKYIKPSSGKVISNANKISYLEEKISLPYNLTVSNFITIIENLKNDKVNQHLLQIFNLPYNKKVFELSKGNQQKLAILVTFIGSSDLIILDEPLNGLDNHTIDEFVNFLCMYQKALVVVTHYPNLYQSLFAKTINI